jgi:hypothetical protein
MSNAHNAVKRKDTPWKEAFWSWPTANIPFPSQRRNSVRRKFAEKADLSTVFISRIEWGKESRSVDNLVKSARALGVRVRDLVEGFDVRSNWVTPRCGRGVFEYYRP